MAKSGKSKQENCQDLIDEWDKDKAWIDSFTRDFPELDNLADGVALTRNKNAPVVGDVTLASAVRQIPRASIQQVPVMSVEVNGTKQSIYALVCDYIVRRVVFNQDTFGKGILSTMQIGAESALVHGFQAAIASIGGGASGDFGTTMKLIHWNDLAIERGVFDANESDGFKVRTRVTRSRLKRIIKAAKANPETTWNVPALEELLKIGPNGESYSSTESAPRYDVGLGGDNNTFSLITDYKNGPYGKITVFSPNLDKPLRTDKSKSKFGYPRVSFLVLDPAQLSPFGISRVRLASPAANYANIYLQSTAKMQLLNADPPVFQKGQFATPIRLKRGALWQAMDPNAEVKLQELSNSTLTQFTNVLEFVDNQIYSIMGVTPGSAGAPQTGAYKNKIASGMEKNVSDLANTQVTNILENFLRQYALTALDLFVSEQVGETPLIVDDKCKNAINRLFPDTIGDDNTIVIDWAAMYDAIQTWTVDIDLSMSKDSLEEKKRADIQDMLTVMSQTADPNDLGKQQRIRELEDTLLEKTVPEASRLNSEAPAPAPVEEPSTTPLPQ